MFLILFFCFIVHPSHADTLTSAENKMLEGIETRVMTDGLDFLKKTVEINSGVLNRAGIETVAKLYEKRLKQLRFKTTWVDLKSIHRGFHLYGEHKGSENSPRLLLLGHMDTVFEPKSGFLKLEKISETKIKGPGISDMKGGNVVMLEALEALNRSGDLNEMNIIVALTGDEESPGVDADGTPTFTRKLLVELAGRSDYALCFEPAWRDIHHATINRRGVSRWFLKLTGKGGHSSQIFKKNIGGGPVFALSRIMNRFYLDLRKEKSLTFNPGNVSAGITVDSEQENAETKVTGKENVIPSVAQAMGDLRFLDDAQLIRVQKKMQAIVETELKNYNAEYSLEDGARVKAEFVFSDTYSAFEPTAGNKDLLKAYSKVSRDLGLGDVTALDPLDRGAGDISFVSSKVKASLDGLGPLTFEPHSINESMDLTTLPIATKRAALFLRRLSLKRP